MKFYSSVLLSILLMSCGQAPRSALTQTQLPETPADLFTKSFSYNNTLIVHLHKTTWIPTAYDSKNFWLKGSKDITSPLFIFPIAQTCEGSIPFVFEKTPQQKWEYCQGARAVELPYTGEHIELISPDKTKTLILTTPATSQLAKINVNEWCSGKLFGEEWFPVADTTGNLAVIAGPNPGDIGVKKPFLYCRLRLQKPGEDKRTVTITAFFSGKTQGILINQNPDLKKEWSDHIRDFQSQTLDLLQAIN